MTKPILGGKPLKFDTPDQLRDVLQSYFDMNPPDEWTVTGLALLVGSKQLLNDYQNRPEYRDIVTEAKLIVENGYEIDLKKHGRSGTIFALKNFDWKDKTETDVTSGGKEVQAIVGMTIKNDAIRIQDEKPEATVSGELLDR